MCNTVHFNMLSPHSIKEAVTFINAIEVNKLSRLLSRILHKLHLKVRTPNLPFPKNAGLYRFAVEGETATGRTETMFMFIYCIIRDVFSNSGADLLVNAVFPSPAVTSQGGHPYIGVSK